MREAKYLLGPPTPRGECLNHNEKLALRELFVALGDAGITLEAFRRGMLLVYALHNGKTNIGFQAHARRISDAMGALERMGVIGLICNDETEGYIDDNTTGN